MAYSPPAGNAINFNLENSYSPPAGNAINFDLNTGSQPSQKSQHAVINSNIYHIKLSKSIALNPLKTPHKLYFIIQDIASRKITCLL